MSFFNDVQLKLANFLLGRAKNVERTIQVVNLKSAKSIGIVYNASNPETDDLVRRYIKHLKEYKLKIKAIGYYDEKELPLDVNPKLEYDFITKKELNLQLEPKSVVVENFLEEEYDILIDTSAEDHIIMQYLVHYSKAKFKVGAKRLNYSSLFDLTIVLKPEEGSRQLMKNIDRYLHIIKN